MQKLDSTSEFYDKAWENWNDMIRYSPAPRIRRTRILSWIRNIPFESLLDVGCGNGEFLKEVNDEYPGKRLTGADISGAVIEKNRIIMPEFDFCVFDLNHDLPARRYQIVVCMEVIEHCDDYEGAIKRLAEMTEKYLFITVPCGPVFEIDSMVGHKRHFHGDEIKSSLEMSGLKVIKLQRWGFPFFNLYKHLININPHGMSKSFLSSEKYTWKQKLLASVTYAAFSICMGCGGYQLFIMAGKDDSYKIRYSG